MQSVGKRARVVLGAALTVGLLASTAVASWATTTYQSYNVTIPKLGGDGYTSTQKKTETDRAAQVRSTTVGGSYKADGCVVSSSSWICLGGTLRFDDNTYGDLWNAVVSGNQVRIKFRTASYSVVNVAASGTWRADKP